MRIGSVLLVLLVALVALGFFIADAMHLREDINDQQEVIEKLTAALQKTEQEKQIVEQEKQNALVSLQNTSQQLQSCQRDVAQTHQLVAHLNNENTFLKEQNRLLTGSTQSIIGNSAQHQTPVVQATAFSLIAFLIVGFGSIVMLGLKGLHKKFFPKGSTSKTGNYVYLSNNEIKELARRRRSIKKTNSSHSDS